MALVNSLSKKSIASGEYYLISRDEVEKLYDQAGFAESDVAPNFFTIDGKECLFTENFVEKDGKEFEIVMVANGFSWEDVLVYDAGEEE